MVNVQKLDFDGHIGFEDPSRPKRWWKSHPHWLREVLSNDGEKSGLFLSLLMITGLIAAAAGSYAMSSIFFFLSMLIFFVPLLLGPSAGDYVNWRYLPPRVKGFLVRKDEQRLIVECALAQTWTHVDADRIFASLYLWDGMRIGIVFPWMSFFPYRKTLILRFRREPTVEDAQALLDWCAELQKNACVWGYDESLSNRAFFSRLDGCIESVPSANYRQPSAFTFCTTESPNPGPTGVRVEGEDSEERMVEDLVRLRRVARHHEGG